MFSLSRFITTWRERERERRLLLFLKEAQTAATPHYKKSLFAHLYNTYAMLKAWGCESHVCDAGLFHSIYGTQIFKTQTVPYTERGRIRAHIGARAERLAYLFSACDRPGGFIRTIGSGTLLNKITGAEEAVGPDELAELLLIECANLRDQESLEPFYASMRRELEAFHFSASSLNMRLLRRIGEV